MPTGPWPAGVPAGEFRRSRAAAEVGRLAQRAGLFSFHYEHRAQLEPPDDWLAPSETFELPEWSDGVLPEPKYRAFRHDLPIASFHPGHRAKWGTHELCHALVGFGWRPDASALFLSTASRLSELVPVVLWYWLDEVGLRRCPRHDGPQFRSHCPECAALAASGPERVDPERALDLLTDAARFVDRELAAVARTRRLGVPCSHSWGSIDLCSDGVAYAAGHARRLRSRSFVAFAERFLRSDDPTWSSSLDVLEARAVAVLRAIAEGTPLAITPTPRWAAWDVGQRLLELWEQCDEPCAGELLGLVDRLAADADVATTALGYAALEEEWELPPGSDVFALGYKIDGLPGRSVAQVREGLGTVVPLTLTLGADVGVDWVPAFVAADRAERAPLGRRFARWVAEAHPGPLAELAAYESALRAARGEAEAVALGSGDGERLARGAIVERFTFDVASFAEAVDAGSVTPRAVGDRITVEVDPAPTAIVFGRDLAGDLVVAEIPAECADAPHQAPSGVRSALRDLGLLVPERWAE
ncbi:MAG: hypothetical protein ABMA64_28090 [Myxococcota bacterium]